MIKRIRFSLLVLLSAVCLAGPARSMTRTINGLEITLDDSNGCLRKLVYPPMGTLLEAGADQAGLLTLMGPATQYSTLHASAKITEIPGGLKIVWDSIGKFPAGKVSAEAEIRAAADGRSVIFTCRVNNPAGESIQAVRFPDLVGLRPFDQPDRMEFRMALGAINPFGGEKFSTLYAPSGLYQMNALRWCDYGSLKGGISLFEKKWLTEPRPAFLAERHTKDENFLRIAAELPVSKKEKTWTSSEYWLTPHPGGWAKGIEVYRDYVRQVNPARHVPPHIRDGVGFQTIWNMEGMETDPARAAFPYRKLPEVARDAKEHGIDEICMWGWCSYGRNPIPTRAALGTDAELLDAVKQARAIGVNLNAFVNLIDVRKDRPSKIHTTIAASGYSPGPWTYHSEFIPAMFPDGSWRTLEPVDPHPVKQPAVKPAESKPPAPESNPGPTTTWEQEVKEELQRWAGLGLDCFTWDVFEDKGRMDLVNLVKEIRAPITARNPEAVFAGEPSEGSVERAAQVLDYTWNWLDFIEAGPYLTTVRYPRINCNVSKSARVVKMGFADGLYINAHPRQPNRANGTKLIREEPAVAAALKEVAPLRKQFLPYFTEGNFLGESVLAAPVCEFVHTSRASTIGGATVILPPFEYPRLFVRGHQLKDRLLVIVLNNDKQPRTVEPESDLKLWLPAAQQYKIIHYDAKGQVTETSTWDKGTRWQGRTPALQPLEVALFEIIVDR